MYLLNILINAPSGSPIEQDNIDFHGLSNNINDIKKLGFPVIVKPATLGSSVGITVSHNEKDLELALKDAISYDSKILVEKMVENLKEVNCSVRGTQENLEASEVE